MSARTGAGCRKLRSMLGGSTALLAAAMAQSPASAQSTSFNAADPRVVSGTVAFDRTSTPGTEVYNVGSRTAVLDFTPSNQQGSGVITFQNAGTTAIYQNAAGNPDFTVLNRIVPTDPSRPIAFNGRVISQIQGVTLEHGGSVWFYSPGGIVVGNGAVFDIGNLLLTTADPTLGTGTIGSTTSLQLNSRADGGGTINVLSGGTINATVPGSYVALVAPVVLQAGTVNTNGSAAYVAAEQATLTLNQGLFTIDVGVGSSAIGAPLQHAGTTRFIDGNGQRRAYFVALPKNEAVTMIIASTGTLGFETATTASLQNGRIILSSGNRGIREPGFNLNTTPGAASNISIAGGSFNAPVLASATDMLSVTPAAATSFATNVVLNAGQRVFVGSNASAFPLVINGNLTAEALPVLLRRPVATASAFVEAVNGGSTRIAGNVQLRTLISTGTTEAFGGTVSLGGVAGTTSIGGAVTARAQDIFLANRAGGTVSAARYDLLATRSIASTQLEPGEVAGRITGGDFISSGFGGDTLLDTDIEMTGTISITQGVGSIRTRNLTAGGNVTVASPSGITTGDVTALSIELEADADPAPGTTPSGPGDLVAGNLTAEFVQAFAQRDARVGTVIAAERIAGRNPETPYVALVGGNRNATMGNVTGTGFVGIAAQAGSVNAGTLTSGGSVLVLTGNQATLGSVTGGRGATDSLFISGSSILGTGPFAGVPTTADFEIGTFNPTTLAAATPTRTAGAIILGGPAVTGNLLARTVSTFSAQAMSAGTKIDVRATASATIAGAATSPNMLIESADIVLSEAATLGDASTQTLTLQPLAPNQPIFFGGDGTGGGYNLSAGEISRLRGQQIILNTITAQGTADVTVRNFTVNGSLAGSGANLFGDAGTLRILTLNSVRVTGAALVNNAAPNTLLFLGGRQRVEVVTDGGGSIGMFGRAETQASPAPLGGTLELVANNVSIATNSLLTQLAANPRFAGREAALAAVPATAKSEGFVQASRVELDGVDTIAVQNSGSPGTFGGFTAGLGGLELRTGRGREGLAVTTPVDLIAFGRIQTEGGGFLTNNAVLASARIVTGEQTAGFSPTSTLNGCVLTAPCVSAPEPGSDEPDEVVATIGTDVQGAIASANSDPDNVASLPEVRLVTLIDAASLTTDSLIEEPVTSGGNATLWESGDADGATGRGTDEDQDREPGR